jgi:hypothetical protein
MNDRTFDTFLRRATQTTDRRAMFGLLASAVLAATTPHVVTAKQGNKHGHDDGGGGGGHGGNGHGGGGHGGNGQIDDKQCRKDFKAASTYWRKYCMASYDNGNGYIDHDGSVEPYLFPCLQEFQKCCGILKECTEASRIAHIECVEAVDAVY